MGVEFEDNRDRRDFGGAQTPKLTAWIIEKGIAKDVDGANKVQITAAIIFFALSLFFFFF